MSAVDVWARTPVHRLRLLTGAHPQALDGSRHLGLFLFATLFDRVVNFTSAECTDSREHDKLYCGRGCHWLAVGDTGWQRLSRAVAPPATTFVPPPL